MPDLPVHTQQFMEQRDDLIVHHPLMTGLSIIPTAQIANLCTTVHRAVITRQLGLCFTAKSGMGKTSAMRYLATFLRGKMSQLVVFNHSCRNHKGGSVRGFFKHFLTTVGHPCLKGETGDLRDRLGKAVVDGARFSGLPVVVMLIDEAQAMDVDDFAFLKDVSNEIEDEGVSLVTVLMAQEPDFSAVQDKLERSRRLDLISRFLLNPRLFRSFESLDDIKRLFAHVDKAPFNENLQVTWTEFFVPVAFHHGFRLENSAASMFAAIKDGLQKLNLPCQIPARQLFAAIRFFLVDAMTHDCEGFTFNEEIWLSSIHTAAILDAAAISSAGNQSEYEVDR